MFQTRTVRWGLFGVWCEVSDKWSRLASQAGPRAQLADCDIYSLRQSQQSEDEDLDALLDEVDPVESEEGISQEKLQRLEKIGLSLPFHPHVIRILILV